MGAEAGKLQPFHKTWLVDIEYDRVDLVKEGANSQAFIKLVKSKGGQPMKFEEIIAKLKPEHAQVIQDVIKSKEGELEDVKKQLKEAQEEIEKLKTQVTPQAGEPSEEDILKSVKDPAVRKLLETQIAKARAAEEIAKKLKEEQEEREAIAKAKEVPNLGAEEQTIASVYKRLKAVDPQLCEDVFGIFKAASALIAESGAFGEIGKSAGNADNTATTEDAAWAKIEQVAQEIAKSKGITVAAAVAEAIRQRPELYDEYLRAQRG
jgi:hypothetical protein